MTTCTLNQPAMIQATARPDQQRQPAYMDEFSSQAQFCIIHTVGLGGMSTVSMTWMMACTAYKRWWGMTTNSKVGCHNRISTCCCKERKPGKSGPQGTCATAVVSTRAMCGTWMQCIARGHDDNAPSSSKAPLTLPALMSAASTLALSVAPWMIVPATLQHHTQLQVSSTSQQRL